MFSGRVSDVAGGPGLLYISGTLSKKGQKGFGWVKRYMSVNTQHFTYYSRAGESFPLGFMDTHDILDVRESEKNGGRRFDVLANGQVLKLMAQSAEEAGTWIKSIRAIMEAVKLQKSKKKAQKSARAKMVVPKWKKLFWDENPDRSKSLDDATEIYRFPKDLNARTNLHRATLKKPRLMRKLLTRYDDDLKLIKLIVGILVEKEPMQRPIEQILRASEETVTDDTESKLARFNHLKKTAMSLAPIFVNLFGKRVDAKRHRRSRTGGKRYSNPVVFQRSAELTAGVSECEHEKKVPKLDAKMIQRDLWFYLKDEKREPPTLSTLKDTMTNRKQISLFKTYLRALYQDENLLFLCDAVNFEKGMGEDGKRIDPQVLAQEGWRIFDKYIKVDAPMPIDPKERERREIRQALGSENPEKAFEPVMERIHELVEEQFACYKYSDFYQKIAVSVGPIDEREICQKLESGAVGGSVLVWKDGTKISAWKRADMVPAFKEALFDKRNNGMLTPEEKNFLYDWVLAKDGAFRLAAAGIQSENKIVRALSYRLLFLVFRAISGYDEADLFILGTQFTEFIQKSLSEARFECFPIHQVMEDHNCLMAMIFNEVKKFDRDFKAPVLMKPGRQIWNPALWPAVFDNLHGTNLYPRIRCLQDAYYHILTNRNSALALLLIKNWQAFFLPLIFDIPPKHQSAGVARMKTYLIAMTVQLLWTCAECKGLEQFAKELRETLASVLAVCDDSSGHIATEILSSLVSRFHSDCLKWAKLEDNDQNNRYRCLYHLIRLIISMALNVTSRKFAVNDALRTHKILPKEYTERSRDKKGAQKLHSRSKLHNSEPSNDEDSTAGSQFKKHDSFSSKKDSYALSTPQPAGAGIVSNAASTLRTPTPKGLVDTVQILNDQQLLYMLKMCYHAQEHKRRVASKVQEAINLSSSLDLNDMARVYHNVHNETEEELSTQPGSAKFVISPKDIVYLRLRRLEELRESINTFGDSDHLCPDMQFRNPIELRAYNVSWHQNLADYLEALTKIQDLLFDLKQQDHQLSKKVPNGEELDAKCRKQRLEVINLLGFVNDSLGFIDLMGKKLWKLLTIEQIRDLVLQFVEASEPYKRRKVFHGWEKEKNKNQAKQTKQLGRQLRAEEERRRRTHTILLIGPGQSGKSTVFKQLTIIHGKGFPEQKRRQFRRLIFTNIIGAMQNLIFHANRACLREDESLHDPKDEVGLMQEILIYVEQNNQKEEAKKLAGHIKNLNDINELGERYRGYLLEAATDEAKLKKALQVKREIKRMRHKCCAYSKEEVPKLSRMFYESFKISAQNKESANLIVETNVNDLDMNSNLKNAVKQVWRDRAIQVWTVLDFCLSTTFC